MKVQLDATRHEPSVLVREVIEAHGGEDAWNRLESLEVEISARGFLFTMKRRPILNHVVVRVATREPRFAFLDFPRPGQTSELIGNDEVRILSRDGNVVAERVRPRAEFRRLRRQLFWDHLDFVYFDEHRHLRRLDYTAEVVGGWARAVHLCDDYRQFNGFSLPTRRRVLPLFWGHNPVPGPTLVAIEIHDFRPILAV